MSPIGGQNRIPISEARMLWVETKGRGWSDEKTRKWVLTQPGITEIGLDLF